MFFTASKIFWGMAQPVSLVFIAMVLSLLLGWRGRRRLAAGLAVIGVLILGLSCFTSLGSVAIAPLENRFARPAAMPADIATIVLLGGSTNGRISQARHVGELNAAGDRVLEALRLLEAYPAARLLATGGSGQLITEGESEAETAQRLFSGFKIDPARLILEGQSRNTAENVALSRELMGEGPLLLVTSASHMPRSMALFRKAGLDPVPWPVDYRSAGTERFGLDLSDPVDNLTTTTAAMREWIGLVAYSLTGQIDTVFPGP